MIHYVYLYLDTRKPGKFIYDDLIFEYEPFYVGQGKKYRCTSGLKNGGSQFKRNKINKIIKEGYSPKIIKLYENIDFETAIKLEIEIISKIGRKDLKKGPLTNLTDGGEGTLRMSKESQLKKSKKLTGQKRNKEAKEKMKQARKKYFDAGNTTWNKGKPWSDEMKLKLTNKSNTGKKFSDEHKKKMSENAKKQITDGKSIIKLRAVQQYSLDNKLLKNYDSIISASIKTNIKTNNIGNCCTGRNKTAGGFKWKYKELL